jgi:hypothetical protein
MKIFSTIFCIHKLGFILLVFSFELMANVSSTTGNIHFNVSSNTLMTLGSQGLGIGTATPSANLQVQGNAIVSQTLSVGGSTSGSSNLYLSGTYSFSPETKTSSANIGDHAIVLADPVSGAANMTLNLPYAGNVEGRMYTIKQTSTGNSVSLTATGSTFDGAPFVKSTGNAMGAISVISSGNQWYITSRTSDWSDATLNDISGLAMWFDAADLDGDGVEEGSGEGGYSLATGGNVVQWTDKGSGAYHLTGDTGKTTPGYHQVTQNGRSVITSSDNTLKHTGSIPDMDGWSVFYVIQPTAWGGAGSYVFSAADNRNTMTIGSTGIVNTDNSSNRNFFSDSAAVQINGVTGLSLSLNTFQLVYSEAHNGHATRAYFTLLNRYNGGRPFVGSMAELIFFNRTLSGDERRMVEAYLKYKWNLSTVID